MKTVLLSLFIAIILYNRELKCERPKDLIIVVKWVACENENNATLCDIATLFIQYPGIYMNCSNCKFPKETTTRKTKPTTLKKDKTTKAKKTKKPATEKASLVESDDILARNKHKFGRYVARAGEDVSAQPAATTAESPTEASVTVPKTKPTKPIEYITNKQCVVIRSCDMFYLPINLAEIFPNLVTLVVWRTGLKTLNDELTEKEGEYLKNLQTVNFRDNQIVSVMELAFKYVTKLNTIDLSYNKISTLSTKLFVTLVELQTLILNNNRIMMLPENMLTVTNPIKYLNVNHNLIEMVQMDFSALQTLEMVLGIENVCANFSMNKKRGRTLLMLHQVIVQNCSAPLTTTSVTESSESTTSLTETTSMADLSETAEATISENVTESMDSTTIHDSTSAVDETTAESALVETTLPAHSGISVELATATPES